jgi:hypothetical protein
MRKKLLPPNELRDAKREIRRNFKTPNDIPPELFDIVFAFYYCGQVAKAKQFFNSVYPPHQEQREYWWNFVEEQMSRSASHKLIEQ